MAEVILGSLSLSGRTQEYTSELKKCTMREWGQALTWLHDSGLALYFLRELKNADASDAVPPSVLSELEQSLNANCRRVSYMADQFKRLNQMFDAAGVKYAAFKGFSLVPEFCPDSSLRHQSDFDYLVEDRSLNAARVALESAGYCLEKQSSEEYVFSMPSARTPLAANQQYEEYAPHTVELHLAIWDREFHRVSLVEPRLSVNRTRTHRWQGLTFPALPEEDIFLLLVIHAFHHILSCWVKMSWLFEIGYFLKRGAPDTSFWERIDRRIEHDPLLREVVVLVTELSVQFFGAPLPAVIRSWANDLRPVVRTWVDNYAWSWALGQNRWEESGLFPTSKLVLFLHREYVSDANERRRMVFDRLLPLARLLRIARSVKAQPSAILDARARRRERVFRRFVFHVTSGLRFLWEIPRWRRLNRMSAMPSSRNTV